MIELFSDIPVKVKEQIAEICDIAFTQPDPAKAMDLFKSFLLVCKDERLKEFIDFYFYLRMEQYKNEDTDD